VRLHGGHLRTVAEDRDAIGDPQNLIQFVRHVDHTHAPRGELSHHRLQPRALVGAERRRRLVHDETARVERERAGDGDQLPVTGFEVAHEGVGRNGVRADGIQLPTRRLSHGGAIDEATRPARLAPKGDVLCGGKRRDELQLLRDDGYPRGHRFPWRCKETHLPVERDGALVSGDLTAKHLDER